MSKQDPKNGNGNGAGRTGAEAFELKVGLAEMLKGGVIMDVTTPEQAKIAEDAGACAVMALERVPADIRKEGGVARMCSIAVIEGIQRTVSIPVMAKVRIGHFVEARVLEALGVDFIDESEVLTPADDEHHVDKHDFRSPFVCGARDLGEALRRIARGRRDDPHQGRGGQRQHRRGGAPPAHGDRRDPRARGAARPRSCTARAKELRAPYRTGAQGRRDTGGCRCRTSPRAASRRRPTPRSAWRSAPRRCSWARASSRATTPARARARSCTPPRTGRTGRGARRLARARRGDGGPRHGDARRAERLANRGW